MRSELEQEMARSPKVTATFKFGEATEAAPWNDAANTWRVTLHFKGRRLTVNFYGGAAVTDPSAGDVLASLILDAGVGETFEAFCDEFGYDPDSRKAEATWKACRRMIPKLEQFLGNDWDRFAYLSH